jgi:hypothetical protein
MLPGSIRSDSSRGWTSGGRRAPLLVGAVTT